METHKVTNFWEGKRVFLTGHTGFKGSWLSLWLIRQGATLTGYALDAPTTPSLFHAANVAQEMMSVHGDVRDADALRAAVNAALPEIVIHMAAQSLVRPSYNDPVATYATNVMGTVHLLDAVRHTSSVRAVVNVTSDKCYENREWVWPYRETDHMGGHDPYSNSKGCAELVAAAYRRSFFEVEGAPCRVALGSARAGNVIGGGDWALDRLVPDLIRGFADGQPVRIRFPNAVRPWQHVLEPLSGYMSLAERLYSEGASFTGGWNFGPRQEDAVPVATVADFMAAQWGAGATWIRDEQPRPHEANYLALDISKARHRLGWHPTWTLTDGLQRTVEWYRTYHDSPTSSQARDACFGDITAFERAHAMPGAFGGSSAATPR